MTTRRNVLIFNDLEAASGEAAILGSPPAGTGHQTSMLVWRNDGPQTAGSDDFFRHFIDGRIGA
jgi:hypothetical protein